MARDDDMAGDVQVVFMPSGRRGRFAAGTPVLDAARALGVYVESVCGGRGICGRCQVSPVEGVLAKLAITSGADRLTGIGDTEARYAGRFTLAPGRRLSCQARLLGDVVIDVPVEAQTHRQVVRKRSESRAVVADPATRLFEVTVAPPDIDRPLGDLDRLIAAIADQHGVAGLAVDATVLREVGRALRQGEWRVTAAIHDDGDGASLIAVWPGAARRLFGIAVDIGSTTIAAQLVDLANGRAVSSAGTSNPQVRFGEDLMSRVSYVMMNEGGDAALTEAVRGAVNQLAAKLAGDAGIAAGDIIEAVVVGNPIMHHLFLGIDPRELGQAPFALTVSDAVAMPAREAGLAIHPGARLYMLPCVAGHVGADAAGAILAEGPQSGPETTLLVDIGTNAEIVLGNSKRILAASSPTGPAFEGAEISAGQRAAPGAIERVRIDPVTLEPRFQVIGVDAWSDEPEFAETIEQVGVTGICGSGIIEAIAEMFLAAIVSHDGVIDGGAAERSGRVVARGRTFAYELWRGPTPITITQNDVRAIQLAKAALYAGVRLLMDRLGTDTVERIRLAGAFGSYIDPKYAMVLGLIPDCALDHVAAVGNAAGTGARMALASRAHRREIEALARRIEKIETATETRFQEHFVNAMALPNKVEPFPHIAAAVPLPPRPERAGAGGGRRGRRARADRPG